MIRPIRKNAAGHRVCTAAPRAVALAVAACFSSHVALANPTNPTVVHGTAGFATAGNILNVTNSHNAIINWGSFSIGVNELTRFIQPSALSAVLNRVTGQDPSAILGALQSNGRVFLINPNGIVFGAGAQIDVAGLVASTLNLSNEDFLANRMRFTDGAGAGSVVNQGSLTGGSVYLIGKAVANDGLITSPNGEVVLAAGNSVELVNPGTPNLRVEIVAPDNAARNLGTISAEAGRIGIYAGLIKQGGVISADSAVAEGGRILLKATQNTTLATGSQTTASGTTGGKVEIQSADTTLVSGAIEAKGSAGTGGTVQVLGNQVGLLDAASINASGASGGGTVLVGGDYQGKNPDVQNAFRTYVGPQATIKADAIASGDGGKVVVWADDITRYYGDISARGGANSGDGGFAEVSGKHNLDFRGTANLGASKGAAGTLLLDPDFIDIQSGGFDALLTLTGGVGFEFADLGAYGGFVTIDPAVINSATANVIMQANEDINVNNAISMNTAGVGIRMQAGGFLNVQAPITTKGGAITLVAGDAGSLTSPNEGALYVNAALNTTNTVPAGANITLVAPISDVGGNSVYINANINAGTGGMVDISGQRLDQVSGSITANLMNVMMTSAVNGDIKLTGSHTINDVTLVADRDISIAGPITKISAGASSFYAEAGRDIEILAGANISSTGGPRSITLFADSGGADNGAIFVSNAILNSAGGNISLTGGNGYAAGSAAYALGVTLSNGAQVLGGSGNITIEGQGAPGISNRDGVRVDSGSTVSGSGLVTIIGTGGTGSSSDNVGVRINNATVQSTGNNVVLIGQGGAGSSNNNGIRISGGALVTSAAGVMLEGYGGTGTSDNSGVKINGSTVQSTAGGLITIYGEGGAGSADNNDGVRLETGSMITTVGNVFIDGFGGSGGNDTVGVKMTSGSTVQSTGGGSITIYGEAGPGVDNNQGMRLEGTALVTTAGNVALTGLAAGSANANTGVKFAGGTVQATGAGNITVFGQGSAGINDNEGIRIETGGAIVAANGSILLNGSGGGSGTNNEGIDIAGTVSNTGPGTFVINGVGAAGAPAVVFKTGSALSSASGMTFGNGFDWSGGTIGGSGTLSTPSGAVTNVTAAVALAPGKTWNNAGTVNISGSGMLGLGDTTAAIFNNQLGGVVNLTSSAQWSFISHNITQVGEINNAGTINVNPTYAGNSTSWEAAFSNSATGVLNIGASKTLSMQNGKTINGTVNIGAGGTLWVSEFHASPTVFSGTTIGGTGILQVAGSGPVAKFTNVSAPGATLKLGGGGQIEIINGTSTFGALDTAAYGGGFGISNGVFAQSAGNLIVPSGASYSGIAGYVAQAGDILVNGAVQSFSGEIDLEALGAVNIGGGGIIYANTVKLKGAEVIVGDNASPLQSSVNAASLLDIQSSGSVTIQGGNSSGAYALVSSSSGSLNVVASGDLVLAGGAGTNAWAELSGNPDVVLDVGGAIRMNAGTGSGAYAYIWSVSPTSIYATFPNLSSGGYFVNGVEGVVYDAATQTGFFAGGSPAVLDTNLLVTYGLTVPPPPPPSGGGGPVSGELEVPEQTLIAAVGKSTEPPEAEKDKDVIKEKEEEKKKETPVCK